MVDKEQDIGNERENKELLGIGGWLVMLQILMAVSALSVILDLSNSILGENVINITAQSILLVLITAAVIQFYRYRKMYLALLIVYFVAVILHVFFISEGTTYIIYTRINFLPIFIIASFFSQRVENTFDEKGRAELKERRKKLRGNTGWLKLIQLQIFLLLCGMVLVFVDAFFIKKDFGIITISNIILLILLLICTVYFYRSKLRFRYFYSAWSIVYLFVTFYSTLSNPITKESLSALIVIVITTVGLIIGIFNSYRIKNTFS